MQLRRMALSLALVAVMLGVGVAPAAAAPPQPIDVIVSESLPVTTPSTTVSGVFPGCTSPSVATVGATATIQGPSILFEGDKVVTCVEAPSP